MERIATIDFGGDIQMRVPAPRLMRVALGLIEECDAPWSSVYNFGGAPQPVPPGIGEFWNGQGGVYAGIVRDGNRAWHVIVPTDPAAEHDALQYCVKNVAHNAAESRRDGYANTIALIDSQPKSQAECPAAKFAYNLDLNGFSDYYLPARDELRLAAINVPELFKKEGWYRSSTQYAGDSDSAWLVDFEYGDQDDVWKDDTGHVRAFRRLVIQ